MGVIFGAGSAHAASARAVIARCGFALRAPIQPARDAVGNTAPKFVRPPLSAICAPAANAGLAPVVVPPAERICVLLVAKMDAFIVVLASTSMTAKA